jgi:integrase
MDINNASDHTTDKSTTFDELVAYLIELDPDLSKNVRRNKASALGQFLKFNSKAGKSIDAAFGSSFEDNLSQFLATKTGSDQGIKNLESMLSIWRAHYSELCARKARQTAGAQKFSKFRDALAYCLKAAQKVINGLTFSGLAKKAGIAGWALNYYVSANGLPSHSSFDRIQRLEEYLINDLKIGIARGLLTGFVSEKKESLRVLKERAGKTEYGEYMSKCQKKAKEEPIRLGQDNFPKGLGEEYSDYVNFKSTERLSKLGGLKRDPDDDWVLRPRSQYRGPDWQYQYFCEQHPQNIFGQIGIQQRRFSTTAQLLFNCFLTFFGILYVRGYTPETFSMVYLVDSVLFNEVFDFLKKRNGRLTNTHRRWIGFITSLLRPEYGYIWQQPAFGKKLLHTPKQFTPGEWHEWCDASAKAIRVKIAEFKGDRVFIDKVRDSLDNVMEFIDYVDPETGKKSPITAMRTLANGIKTEIEKARRKIERYDTDKRGLKKSLYSLEAALLLVTLLTYAPLRIEMFYQMKYQTGRNKKPNLYQRTDGQWAIRFEWREFKNYRFVIKKRYDVGIPRHASSIIEDYINDVRSYIDPDDKRDLLFIASPSKVKQTDKGSEFLQTLFASKTLLHLDKELGPHAARHLVASHIILNEPGNGWKIAADVLHDDEETVREHYAILVAEPGSDAYHQMIEPIFNKKKDDGE